MTIIFLEKKRLALLCKLRFKSVCCRECNEIPESIDESSYMDEFLKSESSK